MVKIQQFFAKYRQLIVTLMTVLLALAEAARWLGQMTVGYQVVMIIVGIIGLIPILLTAISSLQVRLVSIDVLVSIAVIGAFIIGEYNEAAIVTWLFMLGEVLEEITLRKTRSAVKQLDDLAPQTASVIDSDGTTHQEDVDFLDPGMHVLIRTGSQVPVDGRVLTGTALVNEASITGESRMVHKQVGDEVFAGTILENGTITVNTTAAGDNTTFGKIIELVDEAQDSQTKTQRFIDKFSQYYTPFVLLVAVLVGIITRDLRLAITVMVLGCPGALVIGVPASTVAGIGNGARRGILFKGSNVMDTLRHVDTVAFDKTGTLTVGRPTVQTLLVLKGDRQTIIDQAVAIERLANHPLAQAITNLKPRQELHPTNLQTIKGQGLRAQIAQQEFLIGNRNLVSDVITNNTKLNHELNRITHAGNSVVIFASADHTELAIFGIQDQLRPQAALALQQLKQLGVTRLIMLTGDNQNTARKIADDLPIDEFHAGMLPADKADFIKEEQTKGHQLAFVGDGINDSPALSVADVAVAMGSGTDVAMDVSDLVLVKSNLNSLVASFQLASQTIKNMNENILIALLTVLLLFVGLFVGYIEMASGMLIHELSILIVIFNSMRLIKYLPKLDSYQFLSPNNNLE
ncbi:heavy metal translocating P-type ATPase [Limosilactobacillus frumenti DSM 13145]|uniref:Cd(2+)-exporting ATPase n=1 Tax=Limosilactobacillus frumenti DSM 13145 TaxID=1423746 RepID=A0A0R1P121_9LACO|nr:cation-translocating P-type ATPase [Limosilactobacillus frumenti]KRL26022.1 heavy metal translocating P-type ATPase [Limosilactobacillus frumenti DSM 13145]MBA2913968.1 cation-translocating P-type ATPase [Limosilactobacillus frumenti]QFG71971.1 cation-translocating P-type ATPase [Limosilactobacillus frumenti]